jgi:hypothetical protein
VKSMTSEITAGKSASLLKWGLNAAVQNSGERVR